MTRNPKKQANSLRGITPHRTGGDRETARSTQYQKQEESKSMVITYDGPEDVEESPNRKPNDREEEYFRSYRSYMQELVYGREPYDSEADRGDCSDTDDSGEPSTTD